VTDLFYVKKPRCNHQFEYREYGLDHRVFCHYHEGHDPYTHWSPENGGVTWALFDLDEKVL
jgi:hypothetical protein